MAAIRPDDSLSARVSQILEWHLALLDSMPVGPVVLVQPTPAGDHLMRVLQEISDSR